MNSAADALERSTAQARVARWGHPGAVVALWALATLLNVFDQMRFPDYADGVPLVSSILYLSSAPLLGGLVAAAVGRAWERALPLAALLLLLSCVGGLLWIAAELLLEHSAVDPDWVGAPMSLAVVLFGAWVVSRDLAAAQPSHTRRAWAAVAAAAAMLLIPAASMLDSAMLGLSSELASAGNESDTLPEIDEERLWTSQPALVEDALRRVRPADPARANTYLVTVGAGGSQDLFGREARAARSAFGQMFRAEERSVLLANDERSILQAPLANQTNLDAVLSGLARNADASRDLFVLYLASHGSKDAELTTDLPNYTRLKPIGAKQLAAALDRAGIRRRMIVISACYAGSWIKPLASDDTIVVAAARADRTSFGCSDERELTYFGEALLRQKAPANASLAARFEIARRTVANWEAADLSLGSEPQAFVGRNMRTLWIAPPATGAKPDAR